ncbi:signal recognition particle receptor subunit beta-like [Liolophura sinensis]|uniref:signal recognition particle receptor subunit beta-like n=1 Tax=Liolophura sinensis TaxID=3198878 RepID=UPI003158DD9A
MVKSRDISSFDDAVKYVKTGVEAGDPTVIGILVALCVVLFTIVLLAFLKGRKNARQAVLLLGTCDSGKTSLFCKLVHGEVKTTYTSIKENVGSYKVENKNKVLQILDLPGHERLRVQSLENHKRSARGIVFVIDGAAFQKEIKEVADYLYLILSDGVLSGNSPPILIACNKQDQTLCKGAKVIKSQLEKEINTQRVTRSAALQGTDNTANNNTFLGMRNKDFEFSDLKPFKVEFAECSALGKGNGLSDVEEWIEKIA